MKRLNQPISWSIAEAPPVRKSFFRLSMFALAVVMAMVIAIALHHETASANTEVWTAEMTVGANNQLDFEQLGFLDIPDEQDGAYWHETGSLNNTTFTHAGLDFTVNALYYTEFEGESQYLLVHSDQPLPAGLTLQFAEHQYNVADSVEIGWGESVYRWDLEINPGWAEGSTQVVSLTAP